MASIFTMIGGVIKLNFIGLALLGLIIYVFIKKGGQQLIAEWTTQRDNPMVLPFAGALGKNTSENAQGVFYTKFKTSFSYLMKPIQYIMTLIQSILGNLINSINVFRTILKPIREFFANTALMFYNKINGFSVMTVYFFSKMRNLLRRLAATFRLILYTLQSVQLTINSVWYGPIGEVSRSWGYSIDIFKNFFCFHGDTPIKLANGETCPVKNLQIGMRLYSKNQKGYDLVRGISVTKTKNLYQVGKHLISKSHLIYVDGRWQRAGSVGKLVELDEWTDIYCPLTNDQVLSLGDGLLVRDFTELYDLETETAAVQKTLAILNRQESTRELHRDQLAAEAGISATSLINLSNGQQIKAENVTIGTKLSTGAVLGIVKFRLKSQLTYQINQNLTVTGRQLVYQKTTKTWDLAQGTPVYDLSDNLYYSFLTESGFFYSGEVYLTDIFDGLSHKDIDQFDNLRDQKINAIS